MNKFKNKQKLNEIDFNKLKKYLINGILSGAVALSLTGGAKAQDITPQDIDSGVVKVTIPIQNNDVKFTIKVDPSKTAGELVGIDFNNRIVYISDASVLKNQDDFQFSLDNKINPPKEDGSKLGTYKTPEDAAKAMFNTALKHKDDNETKPNYKVSKDDGSNNVSSNNLIDKLHNKTLNVNMGAAPDTVQSFSVEVDPNLNVPLKIGGESGIVYIKDESLLQDPQKFKDAIKNVWKNLTIINFDKPVNELKNKIFEQTFIKNKKLLLDHLLKK